MTDGHLLVQRHTIYACVVGSRAYGLAGPGSDTDRRGVFQAPTALYWHLDKPPTHVDGPLPEQFSWELERCCELALQANPTVLECLWSPLVERVDAAGRELLELRPAFLSLRAAETYGAYAAAQLAKVDAHRRRTGELRGKQAMHMLRLLMAGAHLLRTGEVLVDVSPERDRLLAVRRGELGWDAVAGWAARLGDALDEARTGSPLPAEPDRRRVDAFLVDARRRAC